MLWKKKGEFALDQIGIWVIALAVLVIMAIGYFVLSGKGQGAIEYISQLFKFGS